MTVTQNNFIVVQSLFNGMDFHRVNPDSLARDFIQQRFRERTLCLQQPGPSVLAMAHRAALAALMEIVRSTSLAQVASYKMLKKTPTPRPAPQAP